MKINNYLVKSFLAPIRDLAIGHSIFYSTLPPPPMDGGFDRRGSDFSGIGLFGHVFKKKSNCQGISLLKGYVPTEN